MLKPVANAILFRLPSSILNGIAFRENKLFREAAVKNWEGQDKPVLLMSLIKQQIIHHYQRGYEYAVLMKTDICIERNMVAQREFLPEPYSIKISADLWRYSGRKVKKYLYVHTLLKDSGSLPSILNKQISQLDSSVKDYAYSSTMCSYLAVPEAKKVVINK